MLVFLKNNNIKSGRKISAGFLRYLLQFSPLLLQNTIYFNIKDLFLGEVAYERI